MLVATLAAAPEEASPPLIDIDGTLFIQFGLFLIMFLVLSRVLFKPYLSLRDARHKNIDGAKEEAGKMKTRVAEVTSDHDRKLAAARERGNQERQKLRTEAAAHERQVLGAAREHSAKTLTTARARIAGEADQARGELTRSSEALAKQIVIKILGREAG